MRKVSTLAAAAFVFVLLSAAASAAERPHEGKIIAIDTTARTVTVQSEKGDQYTLAWDDTTKWKDHLTAEELRPGDAIRFDAIDRNGQMFVTEVRRTHRAKD